MRRSTKILLMLSLFIACSDGTFVYINYRSAKEALDYSIQRQGKEYQQSFQLSLEDIETTMGLMATYVSSDPRVQELYRQGVEAVKREGGGPGGSEADRLRHELFDLVQPGWREVTEKYKVRQLHFHMGPGSTSFLRVHKNKRFGDNMDRCRFTVVAVNEKQETVTGFETGRVISGIRGVVPMFGTAPLSGQKVHTGALEAGTSFSTILPDLSHTLQAGLAVLLTQEHVTANVWPEMMVRAFQDTTRHEGFLVEAAHGPASKLVVETGILARLFQEPGTHLVDLDGIPHALTGFHLRDFRGKSHPELPPVGLVLIWTGAASEVAAFNNAVWTNVFYAMIGFCVVEILLFMAVRIITRHLEREVKTRTQQLHKAQDQLVDNARQVGMAQVATEVLHNVGNTLNSIHVTTGQLRKNLNGSRVEKVGQVAGLFREEDGRLGALLARDEKGRQIPEYLDQLAHHLIREQQKNLQDVGRVQERIDHITRIINNQQERCRGGALVEEVQLDELFNKALEINEACLENHAIEVAVDTGGLPPVELDRHRALQVLVNLIRNGAQAMQDPHLRTRRLTLRAELDEDGRLALSVGDTGSGISPENRDKIFNHGFSTKKNGNGFGLHGSANAATEMGGTLIAESKGTGQGAVFRLTIPAKIGSTANVV